MIPAAVKNSVLLGVFMFATSPAYCTVTAKFMKDLEQRESGGRNVRGKHGEVGVCQMRRIAWDEVNHMRRKAGKKTFPFSYAWDVATNREYSRDFCLIQYARLKTFLFREPTEAELTLAYRAGFAGFKRAIRKAAK